MVLNFGETIGEGKPEEISQHPEVIKAYLGDA
jgi:ABC-type branched-chain amino acid transport systems, ATPase component